MSAIPSSRLNATAQAGRRHSSAWLVALRRFQTGVKIQFQCEVAQFSALLPSRRAPAKAGVHAALRCAACSPAFAGEQESRCARDLGSNLTGHASSLTPIGNRDSSVKLAGFPPFDQIAVPRRKPGTTLPCAAPSDTPSAPTNGTDSQSAKCRWNPIGPASTHMSTGKRNFSVKLRSFPRFFPTALLPAMGAA